MKRFFCTMSVFLLVLSESGTPRAADLDEAKQLFQRGKYEESREMFQSLAEQHPVEAACGIAQVQRAIGEYEDATKNVKQLLADHKDQPRLLAVLAIIFFERGKLAAAQDYAAKAIEKDENQLAARWIIAELHRLHGRMDEAEKAYEWFIDYYNKQDDVSADDLYWIGQGAAQFARWKRSKGQFRFLVSQLYPDALDLDKNFWQARLQSALLFLEKFNEAEATTDLNAALAINPNAADVHVANARMALHKFEISKAQASVERALGINPNLLSAHLLQADIWFADLRPDKAIEVLENARKLNPLSEEMLGALTAAYISTDPIPEGAAVSRSDKIIAEVVERNPHCGRFFQTIGQSYELMRRFPQAAEYYEEALKRLPQSLTVRGQLGLTYMRLGREAEAVKLLDESFDMDPFNVRVKNMLEVLDVLNGYAVLETEHFVIKFDRGLDHVFAKSAAQYLEDEVYPEIVERLGYKPEGKTLFEFFNRAKNTSGHSWFSARMVGLPFIGTVGACAGKMVALASPTGMTKKFNWARVLKHEFVHVVNLQQTNFNIPHWFTEGLAVWHEGMPRPPEWNQILARRTAAGKLFNLDSINYGFIRPSAREDWTLAYCQSELYVEFMADEFGDDALAKMLAAYANKLNTRQAIERCFSVKQDEFESRYSEYLKRIIENIDAGKASVTKTLPELEKAVQENKDDADALADLAYAYLRRKQNPQARKNAVAAQKIEAKHQLAAYVLARLQLSIGDVKKAVALLEESLDEDQPQQNLLALLAGLKLKAKDYDAAERLYQLGAKLAPHDVKWPKALARVYLETEKSEELEKVLTKLAALDYDNVTIRRKLAQLAKDSENFESVARWANESLQIDVMDGETRGMLAGALLKMKKPEKAIDEYRLAIQIISDRPEWRFDLAKAHVQAKQPDEAIEVLKELLEMKPDFSDAKALLESLSKK